MVLNQYNILFLIMAFLIGGIPSGYIVAKLCGIKDIRKHGSGNIGASNSARVIGTWAFLIVFFFDAFKAGLVILHAQLVGFVISDLMIIGIAVLFGNCYSPFLQFNGGKGVSTLMGIIGAFSPLCLCYSVAMWFLLLGLTFIPTIASLGTIFALPIISHFFIPFSIIPFLLVAILLIVWRHKKNIESLSS